VSFLRNAWYMIAWSDELGDKPFARTVLDEPVVLFRHEQRVAALFDRCPHRFAPLSMGRPTAAGIECPYHGLQFDAGGRCVLNPFSPVAPAAAKVRTYPVHEADGAVWDQDKPMVEGVQRTMGRAELFDLGPVLLPTDAGGVRMRRKLATLIAAEKGSDR
jgi:phenylpropionate dioxygenase-like ring-hydroxylating dioxygenase large terminal subunit